MNLSVIVPVYNQSAYLDECLESVMAQSVYSMEVLLIDDGSTDDSGEICDRWADQDSRIRVFHTENLGLSAARNLGLDMAAGQYIAFVDSDDVLHPEMYSTMLEAMSVLDVEIVECDFALFSDVVPENHPNTSLFALRSGRDILLKNEPRNIVVWNKIYSTKLWKTLRFPIDRLHEDEFVYFQLFHHAQKVLQIGDRYYRYRQHPGSVMGARFSNRRMDIVAARVCQVRYFSKRPDVELRDMAKAKWYRTVIGLITQCIQNGYRLNALVLRLHLAVRIQRILSIRSLTVYRRIVMILRIPAVGRRLTAFSVVQNLNNAMRARKPRLASHQPPRLQVRKNHRNPRIFSFLEPSHGNLGDHAIVLGQERLLRNALPDWEIISIKDSECDQFLEKYSGSIDEGDFLVIAGGGNLGNVYIREERLRRRIVEKFPGNHILSFPQSVYFSTEAEVNTSNMPRLEVYENHPYLTLLTRDFRSLDYIRRRLPTVDAAVQPDSALFLTRPPAIPRHRNVLLCLRNDSESTISTELRIRIVEILAGKGLNYEIYNNHRMRTIAADHERRGSVDEALARFSRSSWVVTDRLHGVIFSLLSGTPCLAIDTTNRKIRDFLDWFGDRGIVRLVNPTHKTKLTAALESLIRSEPGAGRLDFSAEFADSVDRIARLAHVDRAIGGIRA